MKRFSSSQVINLILPVFRDYGYDGASLTILSEASGLSRGSLYHHFPGGKQEMARVVLSRSGAALARLVMAPLTRAQPAADRIEAMFDGLENYYTGDPPVCLMNSLTLGGGRALFGSEVGAAVMAWRKSLIATLIQGGMPDSVADSTATAAIERIQGGLIIARVCGNKSSYYKGLDQLKLDIISRISG